MDDGAALRAELASLQRQFDEFRLYLPDALLEADIATRRVTYVNRMATLLLGYTDDDVTAGLDSFDLVDADGQRLVTEMLARHLKPVIEGGLPYERTGRQDLYEVGLRRKDGSFLVVESQGSYVLDDARRPYRVRFIFRDITERKAAEDALRRSEARLRQFAANAPVILFAVDQAGVITMVEGQGLTTTGLSGPRLVGKPLARFREQNPVMIPFIEAALEGGPTTARVEMRDRFYDVVVERTVGQDGRLLGLVGVATDVTGLARAQQALTQAQKMESLGLLAGGIAHDFNNVLTTVLGVAGILKQSSDLGEGSREQLAVIEMAARRGADITGRLLTFARGGLSQVSSFDLRDVVHDAVRLARPSIPPAVAITVDLPPAAVSLSGDPVQFTQAILNMLINARDALPEGGRIRVALSSAGGAASLIVEDNGAGMDEETQLRLFEPFFTTKPPGSGTGLGMSITYSVVQVHRGTISVRSAPRRGTTFVIRIPIEDARPSSQPRGSRPAVLVVDDDALVRRATAAVLNQLGFDAVEAADGQTALAVLRERGAGITAVILDLVMPGLSGSETLERMRLLPECPPVFLCSGYAAETQVEPELLASVAGVIRKPFTPEDIFDRFQAAGVLPAD